jgi:NAD(P)-dependent dehydrogenase (short-subunit alcohol dehydrogenase family)
MPDLTGVTAVVTGASGGIGLEAARGLAAKGAHVVLGVRSTERGQSAASAAPIRATTVKRAYGSGPVTTSPSGWG